MKTSAADSRNSAAGGWRPVEVKSTTELKNPFVLDVDFQLCALRGAELAACDAAVMSWKGSMVQDPGIPDTLLPLHDQTSTMIVENQLL